MGRLRHYAVQVAVLLGILGASLTLPGIMRSNQAVVDMATRTPPIVGSVETTGIEQAATLEPTNTLSPTNTPAPSATHQASSAPVPTRTPTPVATETLEPTIPPSPEPSHTPSAEPTAEPSATPVELSIEIQSLTSPVYKGDNASLSAQTAPGAQCQITVYYKSGPSKAKGLDPLTADESGKVSWTWKVGSSTTSGDWRIVIKASINGQEVSKEVYFTVQ